MIQFHWEASKTEFSGDLRRRRPRPILVSGPTSTAAFLRHHCLAQSIFLKKHRPQPAHQIHKPPTAKLTSMSNDRILVLGASGQLGAALCRQLGPAAIPAARRPPSPDWLTLDLATLTESRSDDVLSSPNQLPSPPSSAPLKPPPTSSAANPTTPGPTPPTTSARSLSPAPPPTPASPSSSTPPTTSSPAPGPPWEANQPTPAPTASPPPPSHSPTTGSPSSTANAPSSKKTPPHSSSGPPPSTVPTPRARTSSTPSAAFSPPASPCACPTDQLATPPPPPHLQRGPRLRHALRPPPRRPHRPLPRRRKPPPCSRASTSPASPAVSSRSTTPLLIPLTTPELNQRAPRPHNAGHDTTLLTTTLNHQFFRTPEQGILDWASTLTT